MEAATVLAIVLKLVNTKATFPPGGNDGQVITKSGTGTAWSNSTYDTGVDY